MFCDLTTCYSIERAWCHRLKLTCDELLSDFAFYFNLRRHTKGLDKIGNKNFNNGFNTGDLAVLVKNAVDVKVRRRALLQSDLRTMVGPAI